MRSQDALDFDFARGCALQLLSHAVMHRQAELDAARPTTHHCHLACHTLQSAEAVTGTRPSRDKP